MNTNEKLTLEDGTGLADAVFLRSLVGGLMYLTHTRLVLCLLLAWYQVYA